MATKIYTRCVGIIYVLVGACAFIPGLGGTPSPNTLADGQIRLHFENLFGRMPMNYPLAVLFIIAGAVGVVTSFQFKTAKMAARALLFGSLVLMALGFCPAPISTMGGFLPLYGWTTGFFLITALFTFYFALIDGTPTGVPTPVLKP